MDERIGTEACARCGRGWDRKEHGKGCAEDLVKRERERCRLIAANYADADYNGDHYQPNDAMLIERAIVGVEGVSDNARLIVLAPELAEALRDCVADYFRAQPKRAPINTTFERARALLARVQGEGEEVGS